MAKLIRFNNFIISEFAQKRRWKHLGIWEEKNKTICYRRHAIVQINGRIALKNIQKNFYTELTNNSQRNNSWDLNNGECVQS